MPLAEPVCKIAIDMGGVTYMSSVGLRLLLVIYRTIKGNGGEVVLVRLPEDLRDTMEITGFLDSSSSLAQWTRAWPHWPTRRRRDGSGTYRYLF